MPRAVVLVVDDCAEDAEIASRILRRQPVVVDVVVTDGGATALDWLKQHVPALVLLDLRMPGVDGMQVLQYANGDARLAGVPIVVVTGSQRPDDLLACRKAGAVAVVAKSLQLATYERSLSRVLQRLLRVPPLPPGVVADADADAATSWPLGDRVRRSNPSLRHDPGAGGSALPMAMAHPRLPLPRPRTRPQRWGGCGP